jgi:hypothetical protein
VLIFTLNHVSLFHFKSEPSNDKRIQSVDRTLLLFNTGLGVIVKLQDKILISIGKQVCNTVSIKDRVVT